MALLILCTAYVPYLDRHLPQGDFKVGAFVKYFRKEPPAMLASSNFA